MRQIVVGCASAVLYVYVLGYLLFQAHAIEQGLLFGLDLELRAVTEPHSPVLQLLGVLFLSFFMGWFLYWRRVSTGRHVTGVSAVCGFIGLVAIFWLTNDASPNNLLDYASFGFGGIAAMGAKSFVVVALAGAVGSYEFMNPPRERDSAEVVQVETEPRSEGHA